MDKGDEIQGSADNGGGVSRLGQCSDYPLDDVTYQRGDIQTSSGQSGAVRSDL